MESYQGRLAPLTCAGNLPIDVAATEAAEVAMKTRLLSDTTGLAPFVMLSIDG